MPLVCFGKPSRRLSVLLEQPESKPKVFMLKKIMTSLPKSPAKMEEAKGLIMLRPHVLLEQPGLKSPEQPEQKEEGGH